MTTCSECGLAQPQGIDMIPQHLDTCSQRWLTAADSICDSVNAITVTLPEGVDWNPESIPGHFKPWNHADWNPESIKDPFMTDRDKEGIEERETSWDELFASYECFDISAALKMYAVMNMNIEYCADPGKILAILEAAHD